MSDLNYNFESYDIEGKTSKELKAKVKNFDIIFISGGNNFYLLKIIRESGFDTVLKKWLRQKKKSA